MVFNINNSIRNYEVKQKDKIKRKIHTLSEDKDLILKTDENILIKELKETYNIDNIKIETNELKRCEDKLY